MIYIISESQKKKKPSTLWAMTNDKRELQQFTQYFLDNIEGLEDFFFVDDQNNKKPFLEAYKTILNA